MFTTYLEKRRFSLLFFFLVGVLLFYPYADTTAFGFYAFRVLISTVTILGVYSIRLRRGLAVMALALAVPALLQHLRVFHPRASLLSMVGIIFSIAFDVLLLSVIARRVFFGQRTDSQTIFGALCVYLFIGFGFTGIYQLLWGLQPHSFFLTPELNLHRVPDRVDFLYYSFGSMTALGASGISPVSSQARLLTVLESMLGVLYLAVLISRLMGSYRASLVAAQEKEERKNRT